MFLRGLGDCPEEGCTARDKRIFEDIPGRHGPGILKYWATCPLLQFLVVYWDIHSFMHPPTWVFKHSGQGGWKSSAGSQTRARDVRSG